MFRMAFSGWMTSCMDRLISVKGSGRGRASVVKLREHMMRVRRRGVMRGGHRNTTHVVLR